MFYHTHVSVNFVSDSNINTMKRKCHVRWVPCHHGMAGPQVADGGDGLQIWRVAAIILNKQSRTANRESPCRLVGWAWADNPVNIVPVTQYLKAPHLERKYHTIFSLSLVYPGN
jgi:hypothetical protein